MKGTDALIKGILDNIVNPVITLMIALAIIYFLWGMFNFIRNAESSDERKKGGMNMLWGALGLFIMVTAYGVLNLILGTIGK
jgi:uncharacterized membrane protein YidH (DUF202 family)